VSERPRFCPSGHGVYAPEADLCVDCGTTLVLDRRGDVIGDGWAIDRLIGLGGMRSSVWQASRSDGSEVEVAAVKIAECDLEAPEARRLIHSASMVEGLRHPNIVRVYSYGETEDNEAFMVMELLKGRTLLQLLEQRGSLSPSQAVHVVTEILVALEAMHAADIIHRDIKPANIHLTSKGGSPWEVRLLDLGIAKVTKERTPDRLDLARDGPGSQGSIIGTPEYMAPEQVLGAALDGRADLYATGVVLYRLVTGELPFQGRDRAELYEQQLRKRPPPPRAPDGSTGLPMGLATAVLTALAKQPIERFQSAASFKLALAAAG